MLERKRLKSKKISKTQSVTSQIDQGISDRDVHIGPSDHVPWLDDRKWALIRLEGRNFGDVPLTVELKLEVHDSPNSAGVIIDAVRCAKIGLDRGMSGPLEGPSAYFMKSPARAVPRRGGPPPGRGLRQRRRRPQVGPGRAQPENAAASGHARLAPRGLSGGRRTRRRWSLARELGRRPPRRRDAPDEQDVVDAAGEDVLRASSREGAVDAGGSPPASTTGGTWRGDEVEVAEQHPGPEGDRASASKTRGAGGGRRRGCGTGACVADRPPASGEVDLDEPRAPRAARPCRGRRPP